MRPLCNGRQAKAKNGLPRAFLFLYGTFAKQGKKRPQKARKRPRQGRQRRQAKRSPSRAGARRQPTKIPQVSGRRELCLCLSVRKALERVERPSYKILAA